MTDYKTMGYRNGAYSYVRNADGTFGLTGDGGVVLETLDPSDSESFGHALAFLQGRYDDEDALASAVSDTIFLDYLVFNPSVR